MLDSELQELFTQEEYERFLEFMSNNKRFWVNNFCDPGFVQEFLMELEDYERKEEIVYICVLKYPIILGLSSTE